MDLVTEPNLSAPDDFYEALIDAHKNLSSEQSHAMNARLVLLLANHIGELPVLAQALRIARGKPLPAESTSVAGRAAITPVAPSHAA